MIHPCCYTVASLLDIESVEVLLCSRFGHRVLARYESLVLWNGIFEPLPKLEARANSNGLVIFIRICQGCIRVRFEGTVVLWYGDLNDTMAGLTIEVAAEEGQKVAAWQIWYYLHAERREHHGGYRL